MKYGKTIPDNNHHIIREPSNAQIRKKNLKYKNIKNKLKGYDLIENNKMSMVELNLSRKKSIQINELGT